MVAVWSIKEKNQQKVAYTPAGRALEPPTMPGRQCRLVVRGSEPQRP